MSENTSPAAQPTAPETGAAPGPENGSEAPGFVADPVLSPDSGAAPVSPAQVATAQAAAPAPAVHAGISVDERAYEQYQSLAKAVLDSAEIASRWLNSS